MAAGASPGTGATVSLPADLLPSGEVRRRRALPETLRCRRCTNCSAAIAVVSLRRHLKPLGDLFPRLVLGACLFPSQCTRGSEKPLGQPAIYHQHLTTAHINLQWVNEHGVPRATVPSPTAGVSLAVCPAATVASSPAGRSAIMSLFPGMWGVHPQINAGSVLLPSVPVVSAAAGTEQACRCLDLSPGVEG